MPPYQIAIDPALEIDADAFIVTWNASPQALEANRVAKSTATRGTFGPEAAELILQTAVLQRLAAILGISPAEAAARLNPAS